MTQKDCLNYKSFGDCQKQDCKYRHSGPVPKQEYFLAQFLSKAPGQRGGASVKIRRARSDDREEEETFYIPRHFNKDIEHIEVCDSLLFQSSDFRYPNSFNRHGKILKVIGKVPLIAENLPLEKAFTIDSENTKIRDDAFTIEKCSVHNRCFRIGIHIAPAALQNLEKLGENDLPISCYKAPAKWTKGEKFGFKCGDVTLALSVSFHTTDDEQVTAPTFTVVRITDSFTWTDIDVHKGREQFLQRFVENFGEKWLGFRDRFPKHIERHNEAWKWSHVCEELMEKYCSGVRKSLANRLFIGREWKKQPEYDKQDVVLFADDLRDIEDATSSQDYHVLRLAARGMRFRKGICFAGAEAGFSSCFGVDDPTATKVTEYKVQFTSPIRLFFQFINQQIVLNHMFQNHGHLYSAAELNGLMSDKFATPCIVKVTVQNITKDFIWLHHTEFGSIDDTSVNKLTKLPISLFFGNEISRTGREKHVEVTFAKMVCENDQYFNREIARVSAADYNELLRNLSELSGQASRNCDRNHETEEVPYARVEQNTVLTLEPGVELQLQVSNAVVNETTSDIRTLKIGKNCNYCFAHRNHPDMIFISRKYEVKQLLQKHGIKNVHKLARGMTVARAKNVNIEWADQYYGGGEFQTNQDVHEGDFLCIFAEVNENSTEDFVWNCHAIVSSFENDTVAFVTSSLSQTVGCCVDDKFSVEFLR